MCSLGENIGDRWFAPAGSAGTASTGLSHRRDLRLGLGAEGARGVRRAEARGRAAALAVFAAVLAGPPVLAVASVDAARRRLVALAPVPARSATAAAAAAVRVPAPAAFHLAANLTRARTRA